MHIILRDETGRYLEGILLSATADRMRLVLQNQDDTLELNRVQSQWLAEGKSGVEIECLLTDGAGPLAQVWSEARPQVRTAGN